MTKQRVPASTVRKLKLLDSSVSLIGSVAKPPLLHTESRDEFEALMKGLRGDLKPKGKIQEIYVDDVGEKTWEVRRLRRCQTAIINFAYLDALKDVLLKVSEQPRTSTRYVPSDKDVRVEAIPSRPFTEEEQKHANLPFQWFNDKNAKREIALMLARFGLDESIIEARAMQSVWEDLERLNNRLILIENQRDKLLRELASFQESFASRLRSATDAVIEGEANNITAPQTMSESASSEE